jgi:hypothetical protein
MKTRQHRPRLIAPARTPQQIKILGESRSAAQVRLPAAVHGIGAEPHLAKAKAPKKAKKTATKKATARKTKKTSSSHELSATMQQEIHDTLLAWLQGGDIRLAIEAIAEQIAIELQQQGSLAQSMPGSYQRLGGY